MSAAPEHLTDEDGEDTGEYGPSIVDKLIRAEEKIIELTQENQNNCEFLKVEKDTVTRIEDFCASVFNAAFQNGQKLMAVIELLKQTDLSDSEFREKASIAIYGE